MESARVDFQQLRIKHILYKSKVRSALYGGVYDRAFFSKEGPVDQWLGNIGMARYGGETEIRELARLQDGLNGSVNQMLLLYGAGKIDQAQEGMAQIESTSEKFLHLISSLEQRMATQAV